MFRCKPLAVAIFAIWTLFVWGQRIVNVLADESLSGGERSVGLARAVLFVLVGLAAAAVAVMPIAPHLARRVIGVAAGVTTLLWAVQMIAIPLGDHELGFIVVHLVLGAVSIGLAAWAVRSVRDLSVQDPAVQYPAVQDPAVGKAASETSSTLNRRV